MNISQLLTSIKMDLGIYGLRLPFENPDEALMDVIKLKTLKTFSSFYPVIETHKFDIKTDFQTLKSDYVESIYILPNLYPDRDIVYIRNVTPENRMLSNGYMSPEFDGTVDTYNLLMMTQANADLVSVAQPAITFKFVPPNILHLYNLSTMYGKINVEIGYEHAQNLSTVSLTSWESFQELASLDIKKFLYNALKHYNEIQSAFGTISLRIDDWQNAESDRREIVEKWKDVYHLETDQFMII